MSSNLRPSGMIKSLDREMDFPPKQSNTIVVEGQKK